MSFRPPKLRKRDRQRSSSMQANRSTSRSPSKAPAESLISPSLLPKERRPRNSQGIFISRPEVLVAIPGREYTQLPMPDRGRMPRSSRHATPSSTTDHTPEDAVEEGYEPPTADLDQVFVEHQSEPNVGQRQKREKQWRKWTNEVIPSLLRPHLSLLRESTSLRSIPRSGSRNCTCANTKSRHLNVVCVHFESEQSFQVLFLNQCGA